jgi:hypothetical protein
MKLLNRTLQLDVLRRLAETYPDPVAPQQLELDHMAPEVNFNLRYLAEHDLIDAQVTKYLEGPAFVHALRITAKGLDFLQEDGGIGAMLSVVTVRLEAETLRALIEARLDQSPLPAEEKSKLKQWLQTASGEALKEATQRLVQAALDQVPDALQLLRIPLG